MPKKKHDSSTIVTNARKLLRYLSRKRTELSPLLIMTHDYPDPDALASAAALNFLAERVFSIPSRIVYSGVIGRMENRSMVSILKLPVHKFRPRDLKKYSQVVLVDTQPGFENNPFPSNKPVAIVIDQHPSVSKNTAELSIVDTECGATCVILAQTLLLLKVEIPEKLATALAYGILTDTMNLYRARRPDIFQTYLNILPFADMRALARIQNPSRSRRFFSSLGKGIQHAVSRRGLVVSHLGAVENPDLVSQVTDFLLSYKGAKYAVCTGRYKGKLHVSLRMEKMNISAAEVLRDVMGDRKLAGGHGVIAGGAFKVGNKVAEATWVEAEAKLTERLMKRLRIPIKGDLYFPFRQKTV